MRNYENECEQSAMPEIPTQHQLDDQVKILEELFPARILDKQFADDASTIAADLEVQGKQIGNLPADVEQGGSGFLQQKSGRPELIEWQNDNLTEDLRFDPSAAAKAVPMLDMLTLKCDSGIIKATTFYTDGAPSSREFTLPDGKVLIHNQGQHAVLKVSRF